LEQERDDRSLVGCLILALLALVVVVALLLALNLSSCDMGQGSSPSASEPAPASIDVTPQDATVFDNGIADRVYAALHASEFLNGLPIDTLVHIAQVKSEARGVAVTIKLTGDRYWKHLDSIVPIDYRIVVLYCQRAVLAGVPEVSTVIVVDENGKRLGIATRP
jgi:hypothetical protein